MDQIRAGGNTDPSLWSQSQFHWMPQSNMAKSRNWCFTLNNPSENDFTFPSNLKMLISNTELSPSGTPHYQGYVEFNTSVALSHLRNWNGRGHYEIRKGTQYEAIKYCVKDFLDDGGKPIELFDVSLDVLEGFGLIAEGVDKTQLLSAFLAALDKGKTCKLTALKHLIDEGSTEKEIADYDFPTWCRSHRALEAYRALSVNPRNWVMECIVIYGPTGTEKSKHCNETYPGAYWKQRGKWWDNYGCQNVVILDEFYGWLQYDVLLRLMDRYPLLVESKGGQKQFASKTLVFTSNNLPATWYKSETYFDSFVRRVTNWIYMPTEGVSAEYTDYKEFLKATERMINFGNQV